MPNAVNELIKVTGVSPYSVFSGNSRYSFNKGISSGQFQKGHTYSILVSVGKNGNKYINGVTNDLGVLDADTAEVPVTTTQNNRPLNPETNMLAARPINEWGKPVSDYAIAKDFRIARSGVIQAAVQAVAGHVKDTEELKVKAIELAEAMLSWVNHLPERTSDSQLKS